MESPDNIKDFYTTEVDKSMFASEKEFRDYISNEKNAKDYYDVEVDKSMFNNNEEFSNYIGVKKKVSSEGGGKNLQHFSEESKQLASEYIPQSSLAPKVHEDLRNTYKPLFEEFKGTAQEELNQAKPTDFDPLNNEETAIKLNVAENVLGKPSTKQINPKDISKNDPNAPILLKDALANYTPYQEGDTRYGKYKKDFYDLKTTGEQTREDQSRDPLYKFDPIRSMSDGFAYAGVDILHDLDGLEKVANDITGLVGFNFGGGFKKAADFIEANYITPQDKRDTGIVGTTIQQITRLGGFMIEMAAPIGAGYIPKLALVMGGASALKEYSQESAQGKTVLEKLEKIPITFGKGMATGAAYHLIGVGSTALGSKFSNEAVGKIVKGVSETLGFGAENVASQFIETGEVKKEGVIGAAVMGGVFAGKDIIGGSKALVMGTSPSSIKNVVDMKITPERASLMQEKILSNEKRIEEIKDNPELQKEVEHLTLANNAARKMILVNLGVKEILLNPELTIKNIKDSDFSPEEKQAYIDKINLVVSDNDPLIQRAKDISTRISDNNGKIEDLKVNDKIDPIIRDSKIKIIEEENKSAYSDIEAILKGDKNEAILKNVDVPEYKIGDRNVTKEEVIDYANKNKNKENTEKITINNDDVVRKEVSDIFTKITPEGDVIKPEVVEGKIKPETAIPEKDLIIKPTPEKINFLGVETNRYSNYIPKENEVEKDAIYTFTGDSKESIPEILRDNDNVNTSEINGVKTEKWNASINGDDLLKIYKEQIEEPIKKGETSDSKNKERIPSPVGGGETIIEGQLNERTGTQKIDAGGNVQGNVKTEKVVKEKQQSFSDKVSSVFNSLKSDYVKEDKKSNAIDNAMNKMAEIAEKGKSIKQALLGAINSIKKDKSLSFTEREKIIDNLKENFDIKDADLTLKQQIAKSSGLDKSKKIIVDEVKALKSQIKLENKSAENVKTLIKGILSNRVKELKELGISARQISQVVSKIKGDGTAAIEHLDRLINEKDYAKDLETASDKQDALKSIIKKGGVSDIGRDNAGMLAMIDVSRLNKEQLKDFNETLTDIKLGRKNVNVQKINELADKLRDADELKVSKQDVWDAQIDFLNKSEGQQDLIDKVREKGGINKSTTILNTQKLAKAKANAILKSAEVLGLSYDPITNKFGKYTKDGFVEESKYNSQASEYEYLTSLHKDPKEIAKFLNENGYDVKESDIKDAQIEKVKQVISSVLPIKAKIKELINGRLDVSFKNIENKKIAKELMDIPDDVVARMDDATQTKYINALNNASEVSIGKNAFEVLTEAGAIKTKMGVEPILKKLVDDIISGKWYTKLIRKGTKEQIINDLSTIGYSHLDEHFQTQAISGERVNTAKAINYVLYKDKSRSDRGMFTRIIEPFQQALTFYAKDKALLREDMTKETELGKIGAIKKVFSGDMSTFLSQSGLHHENVSRVSILLHQLNHYAQISSGKFKGQMSKLIEDGMILNPEMYSKENFVNDAYVHVLDLKSSKNKLFKGQETARREINKDEIDRQDQKAWESLAEENGGGLGDIRTDADAYRLLNKQERKLFDFYRKKTEENRDKAEVVAVMQGRGINFEDNYFTVMSRDATKESKDPLQDNGNGKPSFKSGNVIDKTEFGVKKFETNIFKILDTYTDDLLKNFYLAPKITETKRAMELMKEEGKATKSEAEINNFVDAIKKDYDNRLRAEFVGGKINEFISKLSNIATPFALGNIRRPFNETISNVMQHPFTILKGMSSKDGGSVLLNHKDLKFVFEDNNSYTFAKEVNQSKYMDTKNLKLGQGKSWVGEFAEKGTNVLASFGDNFVRPTLAASLMQNHFKLKTGTELDLKRYRTDENYRESVKPDVENAIREAEAISQKEYMEFFKSMQAYKIKFPFISKLNYEKSSASGRTIGWLSGFPIKQSIRQVDAIKTLASDGSAEAKLNAVHTLLAVQLQNIAYTAIVNTTINAYSLLTSKMFGSEEEKKFALERLKDVSSGKFWAENLLANVVQIPLNQYGGISRIVMGGLGAWYKNYEYSIKNLKGKDKVEMQKKADAFSKEFAAWSGTIIPRISKTNVQSMASDIFENTPLFGAAYKLAGKPMLQAIITLGSETPDAKYNKAKELKTKSEANITKIIEQYNNAEAGSVLQNNLRDDLIEEKKYLSSAKTEITNYEHKLKAGSLPDKETEEHMQYILGLFGLINSLSAIGGGKLMIPNDVYKFVNAKLKGAKENIKVKDELQKQKEKTKSSTESYN